MTGALEFILFLLILTNFLLLGSSRLNACIRTTAIQGIMTGMVPIVASISTLTFGIVVVSVLIVGMKGFVFPLFLSRAMRESNSNKEVQPFIGYSVSLFVGILCLIASFWLDSMLDLPVEGGSSLVVPVAISMIMNGLLLIVARRTAINQVLGYLVLENGIYVMGLAIVRDIPLLIELGVLMDLFVAVFVMGIAILRISREFDHIDSDQLSTLKG